MIELKSNPPINQPTNLPAYQPTDENKKNCDTIIVAGHYKGEIKFKCNILIYTRFRIYGSHWDQQILTI